MYTPEPGYTIETPTMSLQVLCHEGLLITKEAVANACELPELTQIMQPPAVTGLINKTVAHNNINLFEIMASLARAAAVLHYSG